MQESGAIPSRRQPFTFSQSSLQAYADCRRRFQLKYLDQLAWPGVELEPLAESEIRKQEALLFHRLVHQSILGLPSESLKRLATSPHLAQWWESFAAQGPDLREFSLHPEITLVAAVGRDRLIAKYDLVAVRGDKAVIYDWKTQARRPPEASLAARWQTRVYCAVLARAGAELLGGNPIQPENITMIYWFAEFPGESADFPYSRMQFERDWKAIGTLIDEIQIASEFPLTTDERLCRFCNYRSLCDRGQRGGELDEADLDTPAEAGAGPYLEQTGELQI